MNGYWFVQPYRIDGPIGAEQPCTDCAEVVAKANAFKASNADPKNRLRIHVPSFATDDERRQIGAIGVDPI